jgi:cytochrome c oxidase assembly protein subunit 11
MSETSIDPSLKSRHRRVALACVVFLGTMFGAAYAAVPLYDWFCRTTGFGGTTRVAERPPERTLARVITVRLDANIAPGLPWRFEPVERVVRVRIGEPSLVHYRVTNLTNRETVGLATYNVTPMDTGRFFNKIQCFCFTDQRLGPGETQEMTVSFFVDPSMDEERGLDRLETITLSYTFFPTRTPSRPLVEAPRNSVVR